MFTGAVRGRADPHCGGAHPGYAVDYVRPGALSIPQRYFYFPDRIEPFRPAVFWDSCSSFLRCCRHSGRLPHRVGSKTACAANPPTLLAAASVVLAAGELLFAARREVVADVVMQLLARCSGQCWPRGSPAPAQHCLVASPLTEPARGSVAGGARDREVYDAGGS